MPRVSSPATFGPISEQSFDSALPTTASTTSFPPAKDNHNVSTNNEADEHAQGMVNDSNALSAIGVWAIGPTGHHDARTMDGGISEPLIANQYDTNAYSSAV